MGWFAQVRPAICSSLCAHEARHQTRPPAPAAHVRMLPQPTLSPTLAAVQEAIKLITQQFVPVGGVLLYNAMAETTSVFNF